MSDGCYFPWQPPLQPYPAVWPEGYTVSETNWQPVHNFPQSSQTCSLETFLPYNASQTFSVTNQQHTSPLTKVKDPSNINVPKQKKIRAVQACEACRYRKQRCNEGLPCAFCKEYGLECTYRSGSPNKFDKIVDFMVTWMSTHSDGLSALAEKMDGFELLLQKAERIHAKAESTASPAVSTPRPVGSLPTYRNKPHRRSVWTQVTQWPMVIQHLATAGLDLDKDYLMCTEDRPVLQIRSNASVEHECTGAEQRSLPEKCSDCKATIQVTTCSIPMHLDAGTTKPIFESFLEHLDTFHSFLDRQQLRTLFSRFVKSYGIPECHDDETGGANGFNEERPSKRRKIETTSAAYESRRVQRSPDNALVLLCIALGEVVSHAGPLPSTSEPLAPFTYSPDFDALRPIPGIGYFGKAIDIIGDHMDGHDLIHAQMFLLAGLYKAQLARVKEASTWYALAGRAITHLIHRRQLFDEQGTAVPSTTRVVHSIQPYRSSKDDLALRAAWACLLLEDEILPELHLPRSGLEHLRDKLLLPVPTGNGARQKWPGATSDEFGQLVYTAQLQLRRIIHQVQTCLFSEDCLVLCPDEVVKAFKRHAAALQQWRSQLVTDLRWEDHEPPPVDLSLAQLRQRYWNAKLTILKPFLYFALHGQSTNSPTYESDEMTELRSTTDFQDHLLAGIASLSRKSGQKEIHSLAQLCIAAAQQTLRAYNGIKGRLVVSNVQHIAHEQFENLLVLTVVLQSQQFSDCITFEELQQDFVKTKGFLAELCSISPTAAVEHGILEGLSKSLDLSK